MTAEQRTALIFLRDANRDGVLFPDEVGAIDAAVELAERMPTLHQDIARKCAELVRSLPVDRMCAEEVARTIEVAYGIRAGEPVTDEDLAAYKASVAESGKGTT